MADITNKRINIYIDQQAAETALQKLQVQADNLSKKITAGQAAGKSMVAELKKLDGVNDSIKKVQGQLDNGLKPSLAQQTSLVSQLRNELKRLSESDPSFAAKLKNYQSQNAELQRMQGNIGLVSKETSNWGNSFEHVLTRIAEYASIYFVFDKAKEFLTASIEEANKAEEATARLRNILENLGRLDAFDRLKDKANQLAQQFKYLDNDDLVEVEQKLITYGKLTEGQINQLLPIIINFADKQKISLTEASEEIQKGLEGTSRVLKNEYGVNMKEGANVTERMSILMKELAPRIDGAAEAFGETMAGNAAEAKQKLADVEEEVGTKLIPALTKLYQWASDAITGLSKFGDILKASFETGSFLTGSAIVRAQAVAAQQEEANNSAAASILLRVADKSVDEKKAYLIQLNTKVLEYEGKLLIAKNNHDAATVKNLQETIGAWQKARDMLDADITSSTDKKVLGFGGDDPAADKKALEEQQKKFDELKKQTQGLLDGINKAYAASNIPAHIKPIVDAAQKWFDDQKALDVALKNGTLTLSQYNAALDKVNKTYSNTVSDFTEKNLGKPKPPLNPSTNGPVEAGPRSTTLPEGADANPDTNWQGMIQKYLDGVKDAHDKYVQGLEDDLAGVQKWGGQVIDIYSTISDIRTNAENNAFNKEAKLNDQRKKSLQSLLNGKLISQNQYNKEVQKLDDELEKKKVEVEKKQFNRNKLNTIAQTLMAGAEGLIKLSIAPGFPADIPLKIELAAETLAKVGLIGAQKFTYATGGKIDAPQNIPTQPNGDNVLAYVKRGEVILNEHQQNLLGGSRTFAAIGVPGFGNVSYQNRSYVPVDYGGIEKTFTKLRFASGGVVPTNNSNNIAPQIVVNSDDEMKTLMNAILDRLNNPVVQPTVLTLKQIDDAQEQKARIISNANIKG